MVEIKAAEPEVRCFFTWRIKGHNRFYGSVWKTPMGLEGSGAFRRGRDRDLDLGGAFPYSRRLTRPYGREG